MHYQRVLKRVVMGGTAVFIFISLLFVGGVLPLLADPIFSDTGQNLGGDTTYDVVLADVDGDNDLDAFVANGLGNRVWLNDGSGSFSDSGQTPGGADSQGVALGDLNGDTFIDAFVANYDADNDVWLNDGDGDFAASGQTMDPAAASRDVALGDLDNDDDLDAFVINEGAHGVWLNGGTAVFTSAQTLTTTYTGREVVLGDVDGDDDLDAYVANGSAGAEPDALWLNDGQGDFSLSAQSLDDSWNEGAALADLDGDGDLDLFLAAWFGDDAVWINQGGDQGSASGSFIDSGQALSGNGSLDVVLVDVDDDNDRDAIVAKWTPNANELWLNDGGGAFTLAAETLDESATYEVAAGDLDGDGDVDLFFANFGANHVWLQGGRGLPTAWFDVDARLNPVGQISYPWARTGPAQLPVALSFPPTDPVTVTAQIETVTGATAEQIPFAAGQDSGVLSVANPQPAVSETVTLTLDVAAPTARAPADLVNPLSLFFINPDEGEAACFLCYVDWLVKLMGFDTSFWMLHHLELAQLRGSLSWDYYAQQFSNHDTELAVIMATHPTQLWQMMDALETWTPAIQAADEGMGDAVIVSQTMADELITAFSGIADAADPELAALIQGELDLLDPESMVGMTMDEVMIRMEERIQGMYYLPLVTR